MEQKSPNKSFAVHGYDQKKLTWCVYLQEAGAATMRFLWACESLENAIELQGKYNAGEAFCKGSKSLGTSCGICPKCVLVSE